MNVENYPTLEPETPIFVKYDALMHGRNPIHHTDEDGTKWTQVVVLKTFWAFFFPGYQIRLKDGTKVCAHAELCKLQQ